MAGIGTVPCIMYYGIHCGAFLGLDSICAQLPGWGWTADLGGPLFWAAPCPPHLHSSDIHVFTYPVLDCPVVTSTQDALVLEWPLLSPLLMQVPAQPVEDNGGRCTNC